MLYLVRGLPGCGKTMLASELAQAAPISADDYFVGEDGVYNFDPSKLPQAHAECQRRADHELLNYGNAVVANTFTQRWELEPYLQMALTHRVRVTVIDLFDGGCTDSELAARNCHGVPEKGIAAMRARYEHDWRSGDPRVPWAR